MKYELALELKNAGFPFEEVPRNYETIVGKRFSPSLIETFFVFDGKQHFSPSLEELVYACGTEFRGLEVGDWKPIMWYGKSKSDIITTGSTPLEAVAHFYLQLKKGNATIG